MAGCPSRGRRPGGVRAAHEIGSSALPLPRRERGGTGWSGPARSRDAPSRLPEDVPGVVLPENGPRSARAEPERVQHVPREPGPGGIGVGPLSHPDEDVDAPARVPESEPPGADARDADGLTGRFGAQPGPVIARLGRLEMRGALREPLTV